MFFGILNINFGTINAKKYFEKLNIGKADVRCLDVSICEINPWSLTVESAFSYLAPLQNSALVTLTICSLAYELRIHISS